GKPFSVTYNCTGFVVTPDGYIATAGHCVNPVDDKYDIDERYDILSAGKAFVANKGYWVAGATDKAIKDTIVSDWKLVAPSSRSGKVIPEPVPSVTVG